MLKVNVEAQLLCQENTKFRGIPFYIVNLVDALAQRNNIDISLSFFDFQKERGNRRLIEQNVGSIKSNLKLLESNSISYKDIMCAIELQNNEFYKNLAYSNYFGEQADVYHFPSIENIPQNVEGGIVVTAHDIMPLLDTYRGKSIWTPQNTRKLENSVQYVRGEKRIQIIVDSYSTKKDLMDLYSIEPERIFVVPLSYNERALYHENNEKVLRKYNINKPYALYVGALDPRKGILDTLEAFEIVRDRGIDIQLVLAGRMLKYFETQFGNTFFHNKYKSDIVLTDYITEEEKRALMSAAEVFLFPSEYEGFGIPILEAMACGAPVITTNTSSIPEVGGNAAEYIEVGNVEQLSEKMIEIVENEKTRKNLIEKGYLRAKEFSWDKTAMMTECVYQKAYEISK